MRINPIHNIFKLMFVDYKCSILVELVVLKELVLIKQGNQKSVIFLIVGIFSKKDFFKWMP